MAPFCGQVECFRIGDQNAKQGFGEFEAARRTIQGYEAVHMIRKGQIRWVAGDDLPRQIEFIDHLLDLAA